MPVPDDVSAGCLLVVAAHVGVRLRASITDKRILLFRKINVRRRVCAPACPRADDTSGHCSNPLRQGSIEAPLGRHI